MFLLCNSIHLLDDGDNADNAFPSRNTRRRRRRTLTAPPSRRLNKDLIGAPTNFVHCQHGDDSLSLSSGSSNTSQMKPPGQLKRNLSIVSRSSSKSSPQDSPVSSPPPTPIRTRPVSFQVSPRRKPVPSVYGVIKTDSGDEFPLPAVVPLVVAKETDEEKGSQSESPSDSVL